MLLLPTDYIDFRPGIKAGATTGGGKCIPLIGGGWLVRRWSDTKLLTPNPCDSGPGGILDGGWENGIPPGCRDSDEFLRFALKYFVIG
jgi:hypothetical protein